MRDLALLFFIIFAAYYILRSPFIGVALSIWTSLFTPNLWVFGFGQSLRINFLFLALFLVSFIINNSKIKNINYKFTSLCFLHIAFFLLGTLSAVFTISQEDVVWLEWSYFYKTLLLYFFVVLVVHTEVQIKTVIWAMILSVSFIGLSEGLKYLASAGGHVIEGVYMSKMQDRNALALAMNMILPLLFLLRNYTENKRVKNFLLVIAIFNIIAILGSFSRGGLIGLIVVGFFYFLRSKQKILISIFAIIIGISAVNFMPDRWTQRMNTIESADKDESFLGRVVAWKQAVLIANDHPFVGVGFKGGQNQVIWSFYKPDFDIFNSIIDTSETNFVQAKAAHSIYFQVMGDMGYTGLFLFLLLLFTSYRFIRYAEKHLGHDRFFHDLAGMTKISLAAYAVAGAALSLPYFDILYVIFGFSTIVYLRARAAKTSNG
jgi:probable O-glycosylation ligase (exosortase A-associated)